MVTRESKEFAQLLDSYFVSRKGESTQPINQVCASIASTASNATSELRKSSGDDTESRCTRESFRGSSFIRNYVHNGGIAVQLRFHRHGETYQSISTFYVTLG